MHVTLADIGPDGLARVTTRDGTSDPDNPDTDDDGPSEVELEVLFDVR